MIFGRDLLDKINTEDLAALIDAAKLKGALDNRVATVASLIKKEEEVSATRDVKKIIKITLVVMAVVACVCGIAYAIYRYLTPDYDDDFDDEFDDFDDDDEFDAFDDEDFDDKVEKDGKKENNGKDDKGED